MGWLRSQQSLSTMLGKPPSLGDINQITSSAPEVPHPQVIFKGRTVKAGATEKRADSWCVPHGPSCSRWWLHSRVSGESQEVTAYTSLRWTAGAPRAPANSLRGPGTRCDWAKGPSERLLLIPRQRSTVALPLRYLQGNLRPADSVPELNTAERRLPFITEHRT